MLAMPKSVNHVEKNIIPVQARHWTNQTLVFTSPCTKTLLYLFNISCFEIRLREVAVCT